MSGYYVMLDQEGDDVLIHHSETLSGAVELRDAFHSRRPRSVLSIWVAGGRIIQPPRTSRQRQQYGDGLPHRRITPTEVQS